MTSNPNMPGWPTEPGPVGVPDNGNLPARQDIDTIQAGQSESEVSRMGFLTLAGRASLIGAAVGIYGFEITPGNEGLRAYVGGAILEATHNPVLAAGAVGGITLVVEGLSSLSTAAVLRLEGGITGRYHDSIASRITKAEEKSGRDRATDFAVAMAVGSAPVVARNHFRSPAPSFKSDIKTGLVATTQIAAASALLGGSLGSIVEGASRVGLEDQASWTLDRLTDWKTFAAAAGVYAAYKLRSLITKRRSGNNASSEQTEMIDNSKDVR